MVATEIVPPLTGVGALKAGADRVVKLMAPASSRRCSPPRREVRKFMSLSRGSKQLSRDFRKAPGRPKFFPWGLAHYRRGAS